MILVENEMGEGEVGEESLSVGFDEHDYFSSAAKAERTQKAFPPATIGNRPPIGKRIEWQKITERAR